MRDHDESDDVEFVVSGADGDVDEDLPEPPRRDWTWLRRWRLPIGVLVVCAAAVAVVLSVRADNGSKSEVVLPEQPVHARRSEPSPQPSMSMHIVLPRPDVGPTDRTPGPDPEAVTTPYEDPTLCHPSEECRLTHRLPDPVLQAVRQVLPGARLSGRSRSVVIFDPSEHLLWQRSLQLRARHVVLKIDVNQPDGLPESVHTQLSRGGAERATTVSVGSSGFTVVLQIQSKVGYQPSRRRLTRLARDVRLQAVA